MAAWRVGKSRAGRLGFAPNERCFTIKHGPRFSALEVVPREGPPRQPPEGRQPYAPRARVEKGSRGVFVCAGVRQMTTAVRDSVVDFGMAEAPPPPRRLRAA